MTKYFEDSSYAYIEYYVGMAKMVAYWHVKALGFELRGFRGPETGYDDRVSFLLSKNDINLVITSASKPTSYDIISFVDRHGNGVKRIALHVKDVKGAFDHIVNNGAVPLDPPNRLEDNDGYVDQACVKLLDRKEIVLHNGSNYKGLLKPGFEPIEIPGFVPNFDSRLEYIDHIAYGVHVNEMYYWSNYFREAFGGEFIQEMKQGEVQTEYSGLLLKVLRSENRKVVSVFVEPANHKRQSQVQEYLEAYYGAGVQHMAFSTPNIMETIKAMRKEGAEFVTYPTTYYDMLEERNVLPADQVAQLRRENILCDVQGDSLLLQTFSKPFGDRPTFFYEIIQRVGNYQGFGQRNITALFQAVEMEQERRLAGTGAVEEDN